MHLMHLIWIAGHIIGFSHYASTITIAIMIVGGIILIGVFYKVFENDLFNTPD